MSAKPRDLPAELAAQSIKVARKIRDDIGSTYGGSDKAGIELPWDGDWIGILAGHLLQNRQEVLQEAIEEIEKCFLVGITTDLLICGQQLGIGKALLAVKALAPLARQGDK